MLKALVIVALVAVSGLAAYTATHPDALRLDRMFGNNFEAGLANLKAIAER